MSEEIKYIIDHAWQVLLLAIAVSLIVYFVGKYSMLLVQNIIKTLIDEFKRQNGKLSAEYFNAVIVIMLFILCLITVFFELCPSALKQVAGVNDARNDFSYYFLICFVCLIFSMVFSPYWIIRYNKEQKVKQRLKNILSKIE